MTTEPGVDMPTVELPAPPAARRRSGFWRELSGALALGLVVLLLAVAGAQVVAWIRGVPGPGILVVAGHFGVAVAAVLGQRIADRVAGWRAALSVVVVLAIAGVCLWGFWWA